MSGVTRGGMRLPEASVKDFSAACSGTGSVESIQTRRWNTSARAILGLIWGIMESSG